MADKALGATGAGGGDGRGGGFSVLEAVTFTLMLLIFFPRG